MKRSLLPPKGDQHSRNLLGSQGRALSTPHMCPDLRLPRLQNEKEEITLLLNYLLLLQQHKGAK